MEAELSKWTLETLPTEDGAYRARLSISRKNANTRGNAPFKMRIFTGSNGYTDGSSYWENEPNPVHTLGKGMISPGSYGWIFFPEK